MKEASSNLRSMYKSCQSPRGRGCRGRNHFPWLYLLIIIFCCYCCFELTAGKWLCPVVYAGNCRKGSMFSASRCVHWLSCAVSSSWLPWKECMELYVGRKNRKEVSLWTRSFGGRLLNPNWVWLVLPVAGRWGVAWAGFLVAPSELPVARMVGVSQWE